MAAPESEKDFLSSDNIEEWVCSLPFRIRREIHSQDQIEQWPIDADAAEKFDSEFSRLSRSLDEITLRFEFGHLRDEGLMVERMIFSPDIVKSLRLIAANVQPSRRLRLIRWFGDNGFIRTLSALLRTEHEQDLNGVILSASLRRIEAQELIADLFSRENLLPIVKALRKLY